jgi:hypothetical protein
VALIEGPYVFLSVSFISSPGTDTSMRVELSIDGGPFLVINEGVALLGERAVYVSNTAPIGVPLVYRFIGEQTGSVLTANEFTLPAQGRVWLKDPLRPWADIGMDFCATGFSPSASQSLDCGEQTPEFAWGGLFDFSANADAGLHDILNAERPADIWARRKYATGTLQFSTRTLAAIDRVYELFTAGGPLQLQLPNVYGWDDAFIQPGDLSWEYGARDQRLPLRNWEVPWVIVDQPLGPIQGTVCTNWCAVEEAFTTFADLTAYPATWLDLLTGDVLCPDTPPELDGFGMGGFGDGPFGDGG